MSRTGVRKFVEYCDLTVYRRFRVHTGRFPRNASILIADHATSYARCLQAIFAAVTAVKNLNIMKAVSPQATVLTASLQQVR
jgi:hypothetical protein